MIARLQESTRASSAASRLYLQPVQDLTIEDRVSRTQYQFTLGSPNLDELNHLGAEARRQAQPAARNWPMSPATCSRRACRPISTSIATRAGRLGITPAAIDSVLYDAFGQRLISTIFTEANQYRVVLEVKPEFQKGPEGAEPDLCSRPEQCEQRVADAAGFGARRRAARKPPAARRRARRRA